MFDKILKYELRAVGGRIGPLYLVFFLICVFNRVLTLINRATEELLPPIADFAGLGSGLFNVLMFVSLAVMAVLGFIILLERFTKSMLGDEGYLTLTLPISRTVLLGGKLLTAVIFTVATTLVVPICLTIAMGDDLGDMFGIFLFGDIFGFGREDYNVFTVIIQIFDMAMLWTALLLGCYVSALVGRMAPRLRGVVSVVVFFALTSLYQTVVSVATGVFAGLFHALDNSGFIENNNFFDLVLDINDIMFSIASYAFAIGLFFAADSLLKYRTNLD